MYDYGQLNSKTEADYIVQIVKNNVSWATSFKVIVLLILHVLHFKYEMTFCLYLSIVDCSTAAQSNPRYSCCTELVSTIYEGANGMYCIGMRPQLMGNITRYAHVYCCISNSYRTFITCQNL